MKLRWRRWAALAILIAGAAAVGAALHSTTVLRLVADRVVAGVDGLEIDAVDGRLATGVRVTGLRWHDDRTRLSIDQLAADWRLLPLLSQRLRIGTLAVGTVTVTRLAPGPDEADDGPVSLDLPWDIAVALATVSAVELRQGSDSFMQIRQVEGNDLRMRRGSVGLGALRFQWSLPDGPAGTATVSGSSGADLVLDVASSDGAARFTGSLRNALVTPTLLGQVRVSGLNPSMLQADAPDVTLSGELEIDGWIESLALRGQLQADATDQPTLTMQLQANWGVALLVVRRFNLRSDGFPVSLSGSGRVDWSSPFLVATMRARWQADDPAWPSPSGELRADLDGGSVAVSAQGALLDGTATVTGAIEWPIDTDGPRGHAELGWAGLRYGALSSPSGSMTVRGSIRAWRAMLDDFVIVFDAGDISVRGQVEGSADTITAIDLEASAGAATAQISGTLADRWDLAWHAQVPDLNAVRTDWTGPLRGEGRLQGTPEQLALTLDASSAHGSVALEARGRWAERALVGVVEPVAVTVGDDEPWRADAPVAFRAGRDVAQIERGCWRQDAGTFGLCVDGAWTAASGARMQAELAGVTLADLAPWLPEGLVYDGALGGDVTVVVPPDMAPQVTAAFTLAAGSIQQTYRGEMVTLLRWRKSIVDGQLVDGALTGELRVILAEGGDLRATAVVPIQDTEAGPAATRPLQAQLRGELSALDLVPALLPEVGTLRGVISADVTVGGTRTQPTFTGAVDIVDGIMTLPTLGLSLTDMTAAVAGDRASLTLQAHARSGDGVLDATGSFRFEGGRLRGNATLRGDGFQAVNLPEAEVRLAPDLSIFIDGHTLLLNGSVHVPYARLAPRDRVGVVRRSADEIVVGAEDPDGDDPWRLFARVRVTIGDARFDGYGLVGQVSGSLTVTESPGLPTRASGALQIDEGRYTAWGQQLEIERGRLLYSGGPISEPGLDVRAVRRPRNVMVGVNVRGTLTAPELRLISEPPMEQAELLSWLVLGMPLQQASGNDRQLLDNATRSAGLAGGELLAREIGRRLGLSDVGIEHGAHPEQAALVIGHYLSPRIYVAWGMGIFDNEQSLRLRYHFNRLWSVEAQTGERATSADIKYSVER